ncbi:MAG: hypothetical protein K2Y37_20495 [Pirellulales bacterium]|nr:hypothetical protein [Pirellulales bacterium]
MAFAVFRPAALVHMAVCLVSIVAFYGILIFVAIRLRNRPTASAVAWIAIRIVAIAPFALAGLLIPGDEGFAAAMLGYFPDLPIWPLFSVVAWIREHLQMLFTGGGFGVLRGYWFRGVDYVATATSCLVYLAWYGGGGYLAARWARRRFARS